MSCLEVCNESLTIRHNVQVAQITYNWYICSHAESCKICEISYGAQCLNLCIHYQDFSVGAVPAFNLQA